MLVSVCLSVCLSVATGNFFSTEKLNGPSGVAEPMFDTYHLKAKFHYAIWFEAGSNQLA